MLASVLVFDGFEQKRPSGWFLYQSAFTGLRESALSPLRGLLIFPLPTHGLRRGLHSFAASRLVTVFLKTEFWSSRFAAKSVAPAAIVLGSRDRRRGFRLSRLECGRARDLQRPWRRAIDWSTDGSD
jgi:hypothetical protein